MLIDSHCHLDRLDLSKQNNSLAQALDDARLQGVSHFLCVSIDLEAYPAMLAMVEEFPDVSVSVGVHPCEIESQEPSVEDLLERAKHPKVVAIGETGLDYFHHKGDMAWQQNRFRVHIEAAKQCKKPLIVHCRDAKADTLDILEQEGAIDARGIMHCFVDDWETAKRAMDIGFLISFSGIVTFKSARDLQEVARKVPLEYMLVETDSPYLAPMPYRGKPNQPAYVRKVAEYLADLKGISFEALAEATSNNFRNLIQIN